jgi:hypothetical protein
MKVSRLKIIKGEDKRIRFFFKGSINQRPINLTDAVNVQFIFERQDRSEVILDMVQIPAMKAFADYNGGKFIATNAGSNGNGIILTFDGIQTIDDVVNAWNLANPINTIETNLLTGTFVPSPIQIRLDYGLDAYTPVSIENAVLGEVSLILEDKVTNSLRIGENQSFRAVLDFGNPPQGVRRKAKIRNILDVTV